MCSTKPAMMGSIRQAAAAADYNRRRLHLFEVVKMQLATKKLVIPSI
jgi:hypothetical protein